MFQTKNIIVFLLVTVCHFPWTTANAAGELKLTTEEQAWLQQHPVINVRIDNDYPPFGFVENGEYQGISYDYLMLIGERLGLTFKPVENLSWAESLASIRNKDGVDLVLVITHTEERESWLNFTKNYINFPEVIYTRNNFDFVSGFDDLQGRLVATESGFVETEMLKRDIPDVSLLTTDSTEAALKAVSAGKADAYISNLAVGSYLIDKLGLVNLKVAAPSQYGDDPYAMAVRKDWPIFANILDRTLDSISAKERQAIKNKWLTIRYEYGLQVIDIVKWVVVSILITSIFIIQLRRMVKSRTRELQAMHDHLEELVELRTAELQGAQNKLVVKERLAVLGQLTATVSHELRNPLGTLSNALHNIKIALEKNNMEMVDKALAVSGRNIKRCDQLVDDLLDYGRSASPVMAAVDVDKLLSSIVDEVAGSDDLELVQNFSSQSIIVGDEERLYRAVLNLLNNSQQALQESEQAEKKISLATREVNGSVEIAIEDNGPGVPENLREKIFEPLFSTKNFGVGLGMTIVRDIMALHHGKIRHEVPEGGGCRFVLSVPLNKKSETGESHA